MAQTLYIAVKGDTKDLVNSLKKAENITVQSGKKMTGGLDGVSKAYKVLAGAAGAYISVQAGLNLIRVADNYSLLESRLKLVTKSTDELRQVEASLLDISNKSRVSYESTANLYARFGRATEALGTSQSDLLKVTEAISKALIVSGATSNEAEAAMIQLSQGLASGTLRGDELRSVLEQVPRVAKAIADGMGITVGQLREFGAEGKLTAEAVIPALISQLGQINKEFGQIDVTVGQATTVLQNAFFDIIDSANDVTGGTNQIAESILSIADVLTDNKPTIIAVFEGMAKGVSATVEVMGQLDEFMGWLVGEMLIGWEKIKYASQVAALGIESSFSLAYDGIAEETADLVEGIGSKLAKLPLVGEKIAATMDMAAVSYRNASNASEEYAEEKRKLLAQHESEIAIIREIQHDVVFAEDVKQEKVEETAQVIVSEAKKASEAVKEYSEKELKAYEKSADGIIDAWEIMHNDRYEVQGRAIQNEVEAEQAKIAEILRMEEEAKEAEKLLYEQKQETVEKYTEFAQERLSGFFSQLIDGDFKNAGEAWDSLWKSMLKTVADTVAQMAAKFVVGKVVEAFFHEGAWNLKDDEYRAVLQDGEMVIPRDESSQIRDALGDQSGTVYGFEGLLKAVKRGTGRGGPAGDGEASDIPGVDRFGIPGLPSQAERYGRIAGSVIGKAGMALAGVPSFGIPGYNLTDRAAGFVGSALFGQMADMAADLMNARDFEAIRDAVEDGVLSQAEGKMRIGLAEHEARMFGIQESTEMRSISDMVSAMWGGLSQAAMDVLGALTGGNTGVDRVNKYGMIFGEDAPGSGGGGGVGPGGDGVGGARGSGDEGSSSPGGRGGYAKGGMVDRLFVPRGDDGLAGLKFGERVLSVQQNENLTRLLTGTGQNDLVTLMKNLIAVVKNQNVSVNVYMGREKMNSFVDRVVVERNRRGIRPTERAYVAG